jgi:heme-degrading monooxygenase HmoA
VEEIMIYEIAALPVRSGQTDAFKCAFQEVAHLLARAKGYKGHQLLQGVEDPAHFSLIVQWQSIEDHTQYFETSKDHDTFMMVLEAYLASDPTVSHAKPVDSVTGRRMTAT